MSWANEAHNVAAVLAKRAAAVFAFSTLDAPRYTTDEGVLTVELGPCNSDDAWRWQLNGKPISYGRAARLIAHRMETRMGDI